MKNRNLVILVVALAVLGLLAVTKSRKKTPPPRPVAEQAPLLGKADVNDVSRLVIESGTQSVTVVKTGEGWVVESRANYPADYNNLVDWLRKLADAKEGQAVAGADKELAEFGLAVSTNAGAEGPVKLSLFGGAKDPLAVVELGKGRARPTQEPMEFGGFPDSQYVRAGGGPVRLIKDHLGQPGVKAADWIDRSFPAVDRDKVASVAVAPVTGAAYKVLQPSNGAYVAENVATNEELKTDQASTLVGALSWLRIADVAGQADNPAAYGLDKPATFTVATRDGLVYAIQKGNPTENGCYGRLAVSYAKPPPPPPGTTNLPTPSVKDIIAATTNAAASNALAAVTNAPPDPMKFYEDKCAADEKKAKDEQAKYGGWVFVFDSVACGNFALPREQVIAPKPPPETNAPPADASAPPLAPPS